VREQDDHHIHIPHLTRSNELHSTFRKQMPMRTDDASIVIVDVAASHADLSITFVVGERSLVNITGPWLTGRVFESTIMDVMMVANDAVQEGRTKDTMQILCDLVDRQARSDRRMSMLTPIIVPVRQSWGFTANLNEGATPGPVDIWIRTLVSRDVR
jgi:hypothetical protein